MGVTGFRRMNVIPFNTVYVEGPVSYAYRQQHCSPSEMIPLTSLLKTPAADLRGAWIEMPGH